MRATTDHRLWWITLAPKGDDELAFARFVHYVCDDLGAPLVVVGGGGDSPLLHTTRRLVVFVQRVSNLENPWNTGIRHVLEHYPEATAIAWVDPTVFFCTNQDVCRVVESALSQHAITQMWNVGVVAKDKSAESRTIYSITSSLSHTGHPGYAWAATCEFLRATGGLPDAVQGQSAETTVWLACTGQFNPFLFDTSYSGTTRQKLRQWSEKALAVTRGKVGCCSLVILMSDR